MSDESIKTPTIRVIPRLDIKGPNLVKGIHLEGLRVLGKPQHFARYYYEQGADELFYQDVVASLYERNSLLDLISETAREIFVPLTVGGGLRTLDDIAAALLAGADKVSINTAAIRNKDLIHQAALRFGSSTIVIAIECIREPNGQYLAYTDNGREHTGIDALQWAIEVEKLGAGEILLTSVDAEGTGAGYDLELIQAVTNHVTIPVIAHGGPGCAEDVRKAVSDGKADAVAVASILHYDAIRHLSQLDQTYAEGNIEFLQSGRSNTKIEPTSLDAIKQSIRDAGFDCRIEEQAA